MRHKIIYMKVLETKVYRGQTLEHREWTTWDNKTADAWQWSTTGDQRKEMPWLPASSGYKTLDKMKSAIDYYLDEVNITKEERKYLASQAAAAAWAERYGAH